MILTLDLPTDTSVGLRRLAADTGVDLETAAAVAIRETLISAGYFEVEPEVDEDGETEGSA